MKYFKLFEDLQSIAVDMYDTGGGGAYNRWKNENPAIEMEEEIKSNIVVKVLTYNEMKSQKDKTIFKRIPFFKKYIFSIFKDNKQYFIVLFENDKIVGISHLVNLKGENYYTITMFSIDKDHRGLGYSNLLADNIFKLSSENNFEIFPSKYSFLGNLIMRNVLKKYADKWNVKFYDKDPKEKIMDKKEDYVDYKGKKVHKLDL